jgi:hypothetical protein
MTLKSGVKHAHMGGAERWLSLNPMRLTKWDDLLAHE